MDYANSKLAEIVNEYIHSERDRQIFLRKFADDYTLERIAEEHSLSVSQVKRIIKKHYFTVFRHFENQ